MITMAEATRIARKNLPDGASIDSAIEYQGDYLFVAVRKDPLEGRFDPFFKVDGKTGAFRDWSPQNYDNPVEVLNLLRPKPQF